MLAAGCVPPVHRPARILRSGAARAHLRVGPPRGNRAARRGGTGPAQDPAALAALLHERLGAVPRKAGRGPPGAAGALVGEVRAAAPSLPQARTL